MNDPLHFLPEVSFPWYAIKVRTRMEQRIADLIRNREYQVYLPSYVETRQYSDRIKRALVALFPGYLFCSLDISRRLPILMTPGVEYFVGFDGVPVFVPDSELRAIDAALKSGLPVHPCEYLCEGDRVRVVVGSMRGITSVRQSTFLESVSRVRSIG